MDISMYYSTKNGTESGHFDNMSHLFWSDLRQSVVLSDSILSVYSDNNANTFSMESEGCIL